MNTSILLVATQANANQKKTHQNHPKDIKKNIQGRQLQTKNHQTLQCQLIKPSIKKQTKINHRARFLRASKKPWPPCRMSPPQPVEALCPAVVARPKGSQARSLGDALILDVPSLAQFPGVWGRFLRVFLGFLSVLLRVLWGLRSALGKVVITVLAGSI